MSGAGWYECHCICHAGAGMLHCIPCCDGKCEACGRHVIGMREHLAAEHPGWYVEDRPASAEDHQRSG